MTKIDEHFMLLKRLIKMQTFSKN